jgi:glyoxylase-like metal-dependent hydrolase (beta-lactamase superfamily II)
MKTPPAFDLTDPSSYCDILAHGVYVIDTGFHGPRFDAAYLLVQDGEGVFIDTGVNDSLPRLLATIRLAGLEAHDIKHVIVTHVHLDHAGGAGRLMQALPEATLVVHPRGARHMINPAALVQGASAVYGADVVKATYGELAPIDEARIVQSFDGMTLTLGAASSGRILEFWDTPGHAKHHHCIWDPLSQGFFTGDTFGLSYRTLDTPLGPYILPTTTPVQFEPEALKQSVQRMLQRQPQCMYLTHYGQVGDVQKLGASFLRQLDEVVALGLSLKAQGLTQEDLVRALQTGLAEVYTRHLREQQSTWSARLITDFLKMDIGLNADGMAVWLSKP